MSALLADTDDRFKVASVLVSVEMRSAIRRRQLLGDVSKTQADIAVLSADNELKRISLLPLTAAVLALAKEVVDRQRLRTLDAIQLATAIDVKRSLGAIDEVQFVAADNQLLLAAEAEGFNTWNPAGDES